MTPYQAVLWAAAAYDPIKPNVFKQVFRIGDWIVGYGIDRDGNPVFAIAGSERPEDFAADVEFLPVDGAQLGMVHAGFYRDALSVFAALRPLMIGKISITGHSLGASRAAILAGLCAIYQIPVDSLFMFEPAKPGFAALGKIVREWVAKIIGTCNARDFVPDLPPEIPFPYRHVIDLVDLDNPADSLDPAMDHMLDVVIPAVLKRWPEPA
jgi:predicted lipase